MVEQTKCKKRKTYPNRMKIRCLLLGSSIIFTFLMFLLLLLRQVPNNQNVMKHRKYLAYSSNLRLIEFCFEQAKMKYSNNNGDSSRVTKSLMPWKRRHHQKTSKNSENDNFMWEWWEYLLAIRLIIDGCDSKPSFKQHMCSLQCILGSLLLQTFVHLLLMLFHWYRFALHHHLFYYLTLHSFFSPCSSSFPKNKSQNLYVSRSCCLSLTGKINTLVDKLSALANLIVPSRIFL